MKRKIQNQEMKDNGWRSVKINSVTKKFCKTSELKGTSYLKIPIRSSAITNIEDDAKYSCLGSVVAHLHPCENTNPNSIKLSTMF